MELIRKAYQHRRFIGSVELFVFRDSKLYPTQNSTYVLPTPTIFFQLLDADLFLLSYGENSFRIQISH